MAETLTELVAKIKTDATGLEKGLSDAERKTEASSKNMAASLKQVGMAMVGMGAAITAAMGLMGKAAIDEEINIKRLSTTIENSGTAYDSVKDSLEELIAVTQRKTGVADDEQRNILNRLILVTNDYSKALELLPTVLDLAAAGEMDATTAATYLGKAYLELEDGAEEVSVRFGQASLQFKNMEDIQNRVAGSAENLANPLNVLKASIGDVAEAIGANLIPLIKDFVDKAVDIAEKVQAWAKEHPELAKTLTLVATALGIFLGVVGTAILLVPKLKLAWLAFNTVFTATPIGLIITAIGLLIAAGIALWQNWDKVKDFFEGLWINIKIAFAEGVKFIINTVLLPFIEFYGKIIGTLTQAVGKLVGVFNKDLGEAIENVGRRISNARQELTAWADDMAEGARVEKSIRETRGALLDVADALNDTTEILEENTDATKAQTEALEANKKALEEQEESLLKLNERLKRTRDEYEYSRSDAGRLGITLKDVTFTLFDMGKTTDEISNKLIALGDDSENVNKVMEAFGLTAQQVKEALDAQITSVDALGESYRRTGTEVADFTDAQAQVSSLKANISGLEGQAKARAILSYQSAATKLGNELYESGAYEKRIDAQLAARGQPLRGYAEGGIVPGPTGMPQLATVHGGETIIPANESTGNVVINFTQPVFFDREDMMNKFVAMIRKGIQRQERLRFGGAYNG